MIVGSHTAHVGFTAGTGSTACIFDILTFSGTFVEQPPLTATGGYAISAVEGQSFTNTVATFTGLASSATINWGDGSTSLGTISGPDNNGVFTVTGTHAYAEESNDFHGGLPYTITVTLNNSTSVSVTDTALVAEAPIIGTGGFTINAVENQSFTAAVATFIDTGGPENPNDPGDYSATINWGDGSEPRRERSR